MKSADSPYPTPERFAEILLSARNLPDVIRRFIFPGVPFAFKDSPNDYGLLLDHISNEVRVPTEDITVVGSARIGFSLDPREYGRPFSRYSDLDVLVVSTDLFDSLWSSLLRTARPTEPEARQWFDEHRSNLIYHGRMFPDRLGPGVDRGGRWMRAFNSLARYPEFSARKASGLLYHSWDQATLYQAWSLKRVRRVLSQDG